MPPALHEQLAQEARRQGVSLNALIVALSFKCRARVARRLREVDESLPTQEFDMDESATEHS